MTTINVETARKRIVDDLAYWGFTPRDADGADFAKAGTDLRFKVGTSHGEVAVTIWHGSKQTGALRAISPNSLTQTLRDIADMVNQ